MSIFFPIVSALSKNSLRLFLSSLYGGLDSEISYEAGTTIGELEVVYSDELPMSSDSWIRNYPSPSKMPEIDIIHGVFLFPWAFTRKEYYNEIKKRKEELIEKYTKEKLNSEDKSIMSEIRHLIEYTAFTHLAIDNKKIRLPENFTKYLKDKATEYKKTRLDFTIGIEKESNISSLTVAVHNDNFSKKIGRDIVTGRIERQLGLKKNREPYPYDKEHPLIHKE